MPRQRIADRYDVERAVGHGSTGTVWLCRDAVLGRHVALKRVGIRPGGSDADLDRAMREARSAAALNHPHVVSVFDTVEENDETWLVMEYVDSRTLGDLIEAEGPLPPERVARLGAQAAEGLAAAHARGIVHRDVKPGNILVDADDRAKITDFGIARIQGDPQLTTVGVISGTPAYLAPEVARGKNPGAPADVWALGVTLYRAVEGRGPYEEHDNAIAMLTTIASGRPRPPERAGVLELALSRMLDPDPTTRWSMEDAAHALRRAGRDQTPSPVATPAEPTPAVTAVPAPDAPPATPAATSGDGDGRRRGPLLLAAAAVVVLLALGIGYLTLGGDDDGDEPAADPSPTSSSERERDQEPAGQGGGTPQEPADPVEESPATPAEPEESAEEPAEEPAAEPAGGAGAVVTDYYSLLPADTEAAWEMFTPALQATMKGGYDGYAGFWRTISSVDVLGTQTVRPGIVKVTLRYDTGEVETREIGVVDEGDGLRLASDRVVPTA
ncbi:serine/threonine-protein kinase [Nocardioides dongkuii]|uniref:serine/threonine-protein kinase n=1 Tax=Nocardioides dongkuii TaxID=2760089 RepID=UPI00187808E7|nr:serine/threonine-protein kinase [Nocardioides dongkuii]